MNEKQRLFVQEYLVDLNATQAAKRAGYSEKTAGSTGWELLQKPEIAQAVQEAFRDRVDRTQVTQDRVIAEYAAIAFADVRDLMSWDEERVHLVPSADLGSRAAATIQTVKSKVTRIPREDDDDLERIELELRMHSKVSALDALAKHVGLGRTSPEDEEDVAHKIWRALNSIEEATSTAD